MSQGGVTVTEVAGGGVATANGQQQARQIAILGVSPGGTVNTIYQPGNQPAAVGLMSAGPLLQEAALILNVAGAPPPFVVPVDQSIDGAVSSVDANPGNAGSGVIALSVAPHVAINGTCPTGGALGTAAFRFAVNGGGLSAPVTSEAGGSWTYRVPGTFCDITFPSGTYTGTEVFAVGVDGEVTSSGASATPATVTSAAGPFDLRGLSTPNIRVAFNAGGDQDFSITAAAATRAGSGSSYPVTATYDLTFAGGATTPITVTAAADAADMAAQINAQCDGGSAVVNGTQVDHVSDRKGSGATVVIASVVNSVGTSGFTAGTSTGSGTVANSGAVTAAELASICSGITNGTATASGGALVFTSTTTGTGGTAQVKSASTADVIMGGEFATNAAKTGAAAGAIVGLSQSSSPVDQYEIEITVSKGGALGACSLAVSLDSGFSSTTYQIPSSGVAVVTDGRGGGTGLVLTCSSTFTANDSYTALALPPSYGSSDVTAAIAAMIASPDRPTVCDIHVQTLSPTAAAAFNMASALETALETAFASGLDWQGFVECPVATGTYYTGDVVLDGGVPVIDIADTDAAIRTARAGNTFNRVAVHASTGGIVSPINGIRTRRPFGWAVAKRYGRTDPSESIGKVIQGDGLDFKIGRDEKLSAIQLGDSQINVPTTYNGYTGTFLTITSGGFALKNLTTSALYQDAEALRALNVVAAATRVLGMSVLADRPPVNADNTIAESAARDYDLLFDTGVKKAVGLIAGGAFGTTPQVSSCAASVLRSSVLGASPRRLDVLVTFKALGMISDVSVVISVQGA